MENKYSCFVYLADLPSEKEVLTVFCKMEGYSKESAKEKIAAELKDKKNKSYELKYVGVINFEDIEQEIVDRQNELFDKYDAVWVLNCSYK